MWLSKRKLAEYLDCSESQIEKLKDVEFIKGIHYHQPIRGMVRYDTNKIDEWVAKDEFDIQPKRDSVGELLQQWAETTKEHPSRRFKGQSQTNSERASA